MDALLPEAEAILGDFLRTHEALVPLHGGRVGTRLLPARDGQAEFPAVRLTLVASSVNHRWEDRVRVQVECWAEEQEEASTLSRTALAALSDLPGEYESGTVTGYEVAMGRMWSPDYESGRARYLFDVLMLLMPAGSVETSD